MTFRQRSVSLLLFLILTGGVSLEGQQTILREAVQVTVIEVPVTVVDRNGNPVRGLTAQNFELFDSGKRQPIAYFEEIDLTSISPEPGAEPVHPAARRNFLILFDLSHSTPSSILRARQTARDIVTTQLTALDLVAVASFSIETGFKLLSGFTADRESLLAAINTLGNPKFYQVKDPLMITVRQQPSPGGAAGGAGRADLDEAIADQIAATQRNLQQSNDDYNRGRIRRQLQSLGGLARALDAFRGRKQIILLSEGFDARLIQGRGAESIADSAADREAVLSGEYWKVDSDQRFGNTSSTNAISSMAELFKRSDVVLHAIDIKGLRSDVDASEGFKKESNESLFLMSDPTGGQFFKNSNDLVQNFTSILKQQEVVYLLGFQAKPTGTPGKFHELRVRAVNVPGARASHRAGYYEPSEKISPLEQTLAAADILLSDTPQDGVPFDLFSVPFPADGDAALVPVIVDVPGKALLEGAPGGAVNAELFIYAFDRNNSVADFLNQKLTFELSKVRVSLEQAGLKYYAALRLPPGEYQLKALVRRTDSRKDGFRTQSLRVPRSDEPVVLSPLIWDKEEEWLLVKGRPRSAAEVDYPFEIATQSFVPAAAARLSPGESRKLALFAYNVPKVGLAVKASVRSSEGGVQPAKLTLLGAAPGTDDKTTKLLFELDSSQLAPGLYSLTVSASPSQSGAELLSTARFEIMKLNP